jgi:hypothetical protein
MNELVQLVKVIREKCGGNAWNVRDREAGFGGVCWRSGYFGWTAREAPSHFQAVLEQWPRTLDVVGRARHDFRHRAHQRAGGKWQLDATRVHCGFTMPGFVHAHLLDDRARLAVGNRQLFEMAIQMLPRSPIRPAARPIASEPAYQSGFSRLGRESRASRRFAVHAR